MQCIHACMHHAWTTLSLHFLHLRPSVLRSTSFENVWHVRLKSGIGADATSRSAGSRWVRWREPTLTCQRISSADVQNPCIDPFGLVAFDDVHRQTLPAVQEMVTVLCTASTVNGDPAERVEVQLSQLRAALGHMEQCVGEMMDMLYHVDVFLAAPSTQGVSGKDPKTALEHVSDLFHVSGHVKESVTSRSPLTVCFHQKQMYQSELLEKREALSDLSCEEIQPDQFSQRWSSMEQVSAGRKQTMDDLADLMAGLG